MAHTMKRKVTVNNSMQKGYVYYRTVPMGDMSDHPEFKPHFTPAMMLKMGVFEGQYLDPKSKEFPELNRLAPKGHTPDICLNYFDSKSRLPLQAWRDAGWIHKDDPRGWFEWYGRFYYGRRHSDDVRQIRRWKSFGPRHQGAILKNCPAHGNKNHPNMKKRLRQRQALLQWSWNPFI